MVLCSGFGFVETFVPFWNSNTSLSEAVNFDNVQVIRALCVCGQTHEQPPFESPIILFCTPLQHLSELHTQTKDAVDSTRAVVDPTCTRAIHSLKKMTNVACRTKRPDAWCVSESAHPKLHFCRPFWIGKYSENLNLACLVCQLVWWNIHPGKKCHHHHHLDDETAVHILLVDAVYTWFV